MSFVQSVNISLFLVLAASSDEPTSSTSGATPSGSSPDDETGKTSSSRSKAPAAGSKEASKSSESTDGESVWVCRVLSLQFRGGTDCYMHEC